MWKGPVWDRKTHSFYRYVCCSRILYDVQREVSFPVGWTSSLQVCLSQNLHNYLDFFSSLSQIQIIPNSKLEMRDAIQSYGWSCPNLELDVQSEVNKIAIFWTASNCQPAQGYTVHRLLWLWHPWTYQWERGKHHCHYTFVPLEKWWRGHFEERKE